MVKLNWDLNDIFDVVRYYSMLSFHSDDDNRGGWVLGFKAKLSECWRRLLNSLTLMRFLITNSTLNYNPRSQSSEYHHGSDDSESCEGRLQNNTVKEQ